MTIVTYAQRYRPKKKKPPAAAIEGSAIVTAKKPGPRQRAKAEPDHEAQAAILKAGGMEARPLRGRSRDRRLKRPPTVTFAP